MKIILNTKELPDWLELGMLGVDIMFDDRPYLEMEKTMQQLISASQNRLAELRSVMYAQSPPRFRNLSKRYEVPTLNDTQNEAVNSILAAEDVAVVHGPPGTGKTTTLVEAVKFLCETEKTVLVTAPSNTAVDLLTERLSSKGLRVVRIGNISRVDEEIVKHTLDMQLAGHPENKNIKKIRKEAAETRRKAQRYRRRYGRAQSLERKHLFKQAGQLTAWAKQLEDQLIDQIVERAQVITCTLVGSANEVLARRKFRTVVIDEAAQALEPATWIPITKAHKVIMTGDPHQLPPTVKSIEAAKRGLEVTLIEKCLKRFDKSSLLRIQYRMNEVIMGFSNQQFYRNKLQAAGEVRHHRLETIQNHPLIFIDTAGCGFEEQLEEMYQSRYNPGEYQILEEHLLLLRSDMAGKLLPSIALISPYREQVRHMKRAVEKDTNLQSMPITVKTIDGFQGQERELVYISLVRSNTKSEIGFLKDIRRMNVAMTRAKKQLIVIGDSATIGAHPFYQSFLEYCENHGSYQTAWEYMHESQG